MEQFGKKMRILRERRGLSLRQLAKILDVGFSYVGKLELGERHPNIAMLVKIADFFEVRNLDLLVRDELELDD